MRYRILHLGVPIGSAELVGVDIAVGELIPSGGYEAIRAVTRAASEALWAVGFLADTVTATEGVDASALGRAQSLPLELQDEFGAFVATDFINVVERPDPNKLPVVFVRFRQAHAAVAGVRDPRRPNSEAPSRSNS